MDFYIGGSLYSHLHPEKGPRPLDGERVRFYASEIVLALDHLHQLGVCYR